MPGVSARMQAKAGVGEVHVTADGMTNALNVISYEHHEIHDGRSFFADYSASPVADGVAIEMRVEAPNTGRLAHMVFAVESGLAAKLEVWEDTTKTHNASNVIAARNRDRNSDKVSGLTICHTPGGSQAGAANLIGPIYFGAATVSGKGDTGGGAGGRHEIILKRGAAYLIKVTSAADGNSLHINMDWYEHRSKTETFVNTTTSTTTTSTTTT